LSPPSCHRRAHHGRTRAHLGSNCAPPRIDTALLNPILDARNVVGSFGKNIMTNDHWNVFVGFCHWSSCSVIVTGIAASSYSTSNRHCNSH
jgi:hypothetical protein